MSESHRLAVDVLARIDKFEREMKKAQRVANDNFGGIERRGKQMARKLETDLSGAAARIGGTFKNFAAGFAGGVFAGGAAGLVSQIGDVARGIATIGDEARRAGLSSKAFQELAYVAKANRVGVDSLIDGMKELNLRADEFVVTGKGPAAEAFGRLGFTATDLATKLKDPSALLVEIIGRLQDLDKAAQIRIADEIFGGTGGERFVELIDRGADGIRRTIKEANDLGLVIDDKLIEKAAELDRKFNAISMTIGTALKTAIVEAADALSSFLDLFNDIENRQLSTLDDEIAGIGKRRLEVESELIRLRGGEAPNDGWFGTGIGATDIGTRVQELQRENEALAEQERRLLAVVEARRKANVPMAPMQGPPVSAMPGYVSPQAAAAAGDSMAAAFIKKFEGYRNKAYWDVNAYRAGFGSDTTTDASGRVTAITTQSIVSLADANRDLARRIVEFQQSIVNAIGADTWQSFSEQQQAALTSIAYNYGELPHRIVQAIISGNPAKIGEAIRNLGDDNGGVNRSRRAAEADMFFGGSGSGLTPAQIAAMRDEWEGLRDVTANTAIETRNVAAEYEAFGQIAQTALSGLANALSDGKIEGRELLQILFQVAQQLLSMPNLGGGMGGFFGGLFKILGFAKGGYTGPGGKYQPAGVVHKGEYVVPKNYVDKVGVKGVEARLRGYANGGPVGLPSFPTLNVPRVQAPANDNRVHVTVGVGADNNGNLLPFVESVTQNGIRQAAPQIVSASVKQSTKNVKQGFGGMLADVQARKF